MINSLKSRSEFKRPQNRNGVDGRLGNFLQPEQAEPGQLLASVHRNPLRRLHRQQPVLRFRLQLRLRHVLRPARRRRRLRQEEAFGLGESRNEAAGDVERGGGGPVAEEPQPGRLRGELQGERDSRVAPADAGQGGAGAAGRKADRPPAHHKELRKVLQRPV